MTTYRYLGDDEFSKQRTVKIGNDEMIWLARMIVGECNQNACSRIQASAILWSMMNRFFLHPARKKWGSFIYLCRRFSQPINPRWSYGGDLAEKYSGTKYTTQEKMERRERIQSLGWNDIADHIAEYVGRFRDGQLPPPKIVLSLKQNRISDFASHNNMKKKFPWGVSIGDRNWFFENKKLINGRVIIDHFE